MAQLFRETLRPSRATQLIARDVYAPGRARAHMQVSMTYRHYPYLVSKPDNIYMPPSPWCGRSSSPQSPFVPHEISFIP